MLKVGTTNLENFPSHFVLIDEWSVCTEKERGHCSSWQRTHTDLVELEG